MIEAPIWESEMVYKHGRKEWLKIIWDACHRTIKEIVEYRAYQKLNFIDTLEYQEEHFKIGYMVKTLSLLIHCL